MKYTLIYYKNRMKDIARECGMSELDLKCIDSIAYWCEMLALIDFMKTSYKIPAYKIGPIAVRTACELAESLQNPESWYYQPEPVSIFGPYNEWEVV